MSLGEHCSCVHLYLVNIHLFGEFCSPECQCLLQGQSNALEEQAVLQPGKVLEVMVSPQRFMKVAHAWREGLLGQLQAQR